jgi:glycosyltransferase involved in cell wall biosynthesis
MRVLWFNWRCWLNPQAGGAEVHVREVARRWVGWGHEVTLFCGKYEGCKEHEELDGVDIIRRGYRYTVYLCAAEEYLRVLKKRGYDAVIDDINGVPFFTPLYIKEPKVAIMHHLVKDIFFKELPWDKAVLGYSAERMIPLVYYSTPFVAVSKSTKEDLMRLGIAERSIRVIHNGIDHELFKVNEDPKSSHPHVVYVGRIKRYKNLDQLLRASSIVANTLRKDGIEGFKLTIAGRGNHEDLRGLAEKLGIANVVDFLGEVDDEEKVRLLQGAWVFVTASMREGWGLTTAEAMASGTPVVGYDVPGLSDSVIDGKTGFLVPYGNVEEMAEKLVQVIRDERLKKELSQNAFEWSTNFDWTRTAEELVDFIESIMM